MKIDYKKFNEYSEKSQLRIITFVRLLLSLIEINNGRKILYSDLEKEGFSYEEFFSLTLKLNEILDGVVINIENHSTWEGPMQVRSFHGKISLKYKPDAVSIINSFLENIENNKIILVINEKDKKIAQKFNPELSYSFRSYGGKNKRFDHLLALAGNKIKISGKELDPNVSLQALSGEIKEVNKKLMKDLKLKKEIIINDNKSGYEISQDFYDFEIV